MLINVMDQAWLHNTVCCHPTVNHENILHGTLDIVVYHYTTATQFWCSPVSAGMITQKYNITH